MKPRIMGVLDSLRRQYPEGIDAAEVETLMAVLTTMRKVDAKSDNPLRNRETYRALIGKNVRGKHSSE